MFLKTFNLWVLKSNDSTGWMINKSNYSLYIYEPGNNKSDIIYNVHNSRYK